MSLPCTSVALSALQPPADPADAVVRIELHGFAADGRLVVIETLTLEQIRSLTAGAIVRGALAEMGA